MSIKVKCSFCNKELNKPGALLFSPPATYDLFSGLTRNIEMVCEKFHICQKCFEKIMEIKQRTKLDTKQK